MSRSSSLKTGLVLYECALVANFLAPFGYSIDFTSPHMWGLVTLTGVVVPWLICILNIVYNRLPFKILAILALIPLSLFTLGGFMLILDAMKELSTGESGSKQLEGSEVVDDRTTKCWRINRTGAAGRDGLVVRLETRLMPGLILIKYCKQNWSNAHWVRQLIGRAYACRISW